ncbi:aldo/keto reductase [uncultured Ruminococcus sp.]|uniref:aldo/keto reductase n=1 Tax=uncultured Ruminococcus sp. TaxID=165186 RepID=UPI002605DDE2|nr:aldo/keto reductase [uncultured Ruminococcus sp.]
MEQYTLANGVQIPVIGLGTWQTPDDETGYQAVLSALQIGYRHIDTAQGYRNEDIVGRAVKDSGISREEIFITSKLDNPNHGYDKTMRSFEGTLAQLGTDYVDLFLIHWPNPLQYRKTWQQTNAETWKAFEELYRAGKIRAIGVSNFRQHHIDEIMKTAEIAPMVNQIRLCPGETQDGLVAYCKECNILLEAYSPLGTGQIFKVPEMQALAEKYQKSIAQICIRWSLQMGFLPLPKSVTAERIRENMDVFGFELSEDDVKLIAGLTGCVGLSKDPDTINW